MDKWLKALRPQARKEITAETFTSGLPEVVYASIVDIPRRVDLEALNDVINHAMKLFGHRSVESDAWLAPRLHATLRLYRSEAADRRIWDYLSVIAFAGYVKWRWTKVGKL